MSYVAYFLYEINGLNGGMPLDFQMHVCFFLKICSEQITSIILLVVG